MHAFGRRGISEATRANSVLTPKDVSDGLQILRMNQVPIENGPAYDNEASE